MLTSEVFVVENIKCDGCVKTIEENIGALPSVQNVHADKETHHVEITGIGLDRDMLRKKLATLGYPEKGDNSVYKKVKSFLHCAVPK